MQVKRVRSLDLPTGVPIPHFDTMAEALKHVNGKELVLIDVLNKYGRQKDSLVNARSTISEKLEEWGFKQVNKDSTPLTGTDKDIPEQEGKHIDRAVAAAVAGKFTPPGLTVTGTDDKTKTASVWLFIQTAIIDKVEGGFPFDLNAATRVGKAKNPPAYALAGAKSIIEGGADRITQWAEKFTKGYKAADGTKVDPIAFDPFNVVAAPGSTAEVVESTKVANVTALAWAIHTVEEQKRAKQSQKEYV